MNIDSYCIDTEGGGLVPDSANLQATCDQDRDLLGYLELLLRFGGTISLSDRNGETWRYKVKQGEITVETTEVHQSASEGSE